jgi:LPS O-antigen subunit length determinant protein (WzzB/FepE family)
VSLLDILVILARQRTLILRIVLGVTLLGTCYAILAPEEYTSNARVVRESQSDTPDIGGLGGGLAALQGLGIGGLTGAASGLSPQAFPSVLNSREVKLGVATDTFSYPDADDRLSFVDYVNRPPGVVETILNYTIKLPFTLRKNLSEAPRGEQQTTMAENMALWRLDQMVSSRIDQQSGLMTISVTASGPDLAAEMTQSFVDHLTRRVRNIRTKKVRKQLDFVEGRFEEAQNELETAENRLAEFLERNQNPTTAQLRFQRDRLQRQVRFKEQLYSELQGRLTQVRLDLQRQQPVVTMVEEPVEPMEPSAPNRKLIVLLSIFLGGFLAVISAFLVSFFSTDDEDRERREKVAQIREAFVPEQLIERVREYLPMQKS